MKKKFWTGRLKTILIVALVIAICAAVTLAIVALNTSVVLCWWGLTRLGVSIDVQLYAVVVMGFLVTFGLYHFMEWHLRRNTSFLRAVRRLGYRTHVSRRGVFLRMQHFLDRL